MTQTQDAAPTTSVGLIQPHGGILKDLMASEERAKELKAEALHLSAWDLNERQLCDTDLLLSGGFSPLEGFMGVADYDRVCDELRLADGALWSIPITLDVSEEFAASLSRGSRVALRHPEGMVLAILTVGDVWQPDIAKEARSVFGSEDDFHPGVFRLFNQTNPFYVGGTLEGVEAPPQHTFQDLRQTPAQLRQVFEQKGWSNVVAFQTRNPLHRAHVELTQRAARETGAHLLIHPVVGQTKPGDVDYFIRARCYQAVLKYYPQESTMLSLLPLAMRMAGPREAVWHAIIRKNYGCNNLIVGRDHAGPGSDRSGKPFYGPYDAQDLVRQHEEELGVRLAAFPEMVYVEEVDRYLPVTEVPEGAKVLSVSGTELRDRLSSGDDLPSWFSYPDVITELRRSYPLKSEQGFTVFFTGLPSSGKSTLANVLLAKLMEHGARPVTLLDGDLVRKHLSSELGFSKEHRDLNITRIGYVASEITKHRGVAICAPIAPYAATRRQVRDMVSEYGGFFEVHVATPLEVCEERDRKGLYAKARAGVIKGFTGIDDPYEIPEHAELAIDTTDLTAEEAVAQIMGRLQEEGYVLAS